MTDHSPTIQGAGFPPLPATPFSRNSGNFAPLYTADHMRAYALADRASRAAGQEAVAWREPATGKKALQVADLAHEIWAAAQLAPGEGIEDAVSRIQAIFAADRSVPWPQVDAYSGGAGSGGVASWLKVRLGDGPETTEFIRKDLTHPAPETGRVAVAWVDGRNLASAQISRERGGPFDTHVWSEGKTAIHNTPLYASLAPNYSPENPPRLRREGESVESYRAAMGWAPAPVAQAVVVEALSELLSLIQRNAPDLSGKVVGNAKAVRAALDALTAPRPEASAVQPAQALLIPDGELRDELECMLKGLQQWSMLTEKTHAEILERLETALDRLLDYSIPPDEPAQVVSRSEKLRSAGYTARPSPFSCDECGKVFSSVTFLQAHECAFAGATHAPSSAVAEPAISQDAEMLAGAHEVIRIWNERARKFGFDGVAGMLNTFRHGEVTSPASPDVAKMVAHATTAAHNLARQHLSTDLGKLINLINDLGAAATQARAAASEPLSVSEREVKP